MLEWMHCMVLAASPVAAAERGVRKYTNRYGTHGTRRTEIRHAVKGASRDQRETAELRPGRPDKMRLPAGITCGDCAHIRRCR